MTPEEYGACDGEDLAGLVRSGQVTAREVLDAALGAVEFLDGALNAFVTVTREVARDQLAAGLPAGPLSGVPLALKDECQVITGAPVRSASRFPAEVGGDVETSLVRRYRDAGLLLIGRTNLPEFGASVTTEPVATGTTRNPWDPSRTVGGSSGGSAAAVAAGIVPVAYANDGAGSIRIPASCTGTFGLKPTRGRTPAGPFVGEMWQGLVIEHAITRSVRDSAALLDLTHGPDLGAPYTAPHAPVSYRALVTLDPRPLRIGLSTAAPGGSRVDAACVEAVEAAARLLDGLGHDVEPAEPSHDGAALHAAVGDLLALELAVAVDAAAVRTGVPARPELVEPANWALAERARRFSALDLQARLGELNSIRREAATFWQGYDLWLTPTLGTLPPHHGHVTPLLGDVDRYLERWFELAPFTPLANVTGNPSMSLPLHQHDGLPVGVCLTAGFGREDVLVQVAGQIERAAPWASRRPPLYVGAPELVAG
jgi:Asp-tRNA(Asn)/Glu-tRNA(Gln) amidotransferase A subunit family amidase